MSANPNRKIQQRSNTGNKSQGRALSSWLCLALAVVSAAAVDAAGFGLIVPPQPKPFWITTISLTAIQLLLAEGVRRFAPNLGTTSTSRQLWAATITIIGFVIETTLRLSLNSTYLFDSLLLCLVRNATIALASLSHHRSAQGPTVVLATFLIVFASACFAGSHETIPWCRGILATFTLLAVTWLIKQYWEGIEASLAAATVQRRRLWWTPLLTILVASPLLIPASGGQLVATEGWMPTSGGGDDASSMARDGIGDGDLLVAGLDNIRSFAPIENAPFASSHKPTLYDVFDDTYNEPTFIKTKQQRAIALEPQLKALAEDHRMAQSARASREFSTVRRPGSLTRHSIASLDSQAVMYVRGRLPLHLKLESFDIYDGDRWVAEPLPTSPPPLTLETVAERPWLRLGVVAKPNDPYATPEIHSLVLANFDTNKVPTPNQLTGVSIDKLDRANFFAWQQPGIVGVDIDRLPEMTTLHLQSRVIDQRQLNDLEWRSDRLLQYQQIDKGSSSLQVQDLAEQWVEGLPRGWPQIKKIVSKLREEYQFVPESRASGDTGHSVAEFLFEKKQGPDYLFASAAVWLLRALKYPARFVSGFYVSPARFDTRSDHATVLPEDAHCWVEVCIKSDIWISLEPTPGYDMLGPPMTLIETFLVSVTSIYLAVANRPLPFFLFFVSLILLVTFRKRLSDVVDIALLRLRRFHKENLLPQRTFNVLDRRCHRIGLPRPPGISANRWLHQLADDIVTCRPTECRPSSLPNSVKQFLTGVDRCLYGSPNQSTTDTSTCKSALEFWSWRNLKMIQRHQNDT